VSAAALLPPSAPSRVSAGYYVENVSTGPGAATPCQPGYLEKAKLLGQIGHQLTTRQVVEHNKLVDEVEARGRERETRRARFRRKRALARAGLLSKRMATCGEHPIVKKREGEVPMRVVVKTDGRASHRGVGHCRTRTCECCGPILFAQDAELIAAVVDEHGQDRTLMVTATVKHHRGLDLKPLRKAFTLAWRKMLQHSTWGAFELLRGVGVVRVFECPYGDANGWHPHYHAALFLQSAVTDAELAALQGFISQLWRDTVERVIGEAYRPTLEHGIDVSRWHRDGYMTKLGLAAELTDAGQAKRSDRGLRSYFQMTHDWEANGADALRIREYIEATKGMQVVAFGKGLRARARKLLEAKKPKASEREGADLYTEEFKALRHVKTDDGRDALIAVLEVAELAEPGHVDEDVRAFVDDLLRRKRRTMTVEDRRERSPPVHRPYPAGAA
jgi:hypothetical protein